MIPGTPTSHQERQQRELRIEDAALIERGRAGLAEEMQAQGRLQHREIDLSLEEGADRPEPRDP